MSETKDRRARRRAPRWVSAAAILCGLVGALVLASQPGRMPTASAEPNSPVTSVSTGPSSESAPPSGSSPVAPRPRPRAPTLYHPVGCMRHGGAGPYFNGPSWHKVVALTFDDGPWPDTPAFVKLLEARHVPATFFMIGEQVTSGYRQLLQRELRDGDALGDHTFTHADLTRTGGTFGQLQSTIFAIRRLTGYTPCVFRPPYGNFNQEVVRVAGSLRLATIVWNVDPTDWARPGSEAIEQRVLSQTRPGSIVLSHDGGGPRGETLAAYPHIINALKERGYRFETVPQLLGFHTIYKRCIKQCEGAGVHLPLPPGSVIEK